MLMTIRDMHYDFKQKLDKVDSQQNRNLQVPEIDWKLNEGLEVFIKLIAEPRQSPGGFESIQRSKDDIRLLVKKQFFDKGQCIAVSQIDDKTFLAPLPEDYMFYTSARAIATKGGCTNVELVVLTPQSDDLSEETVFYDPSFEWRETNAYFSEEGLLIKTDGTFQISHVCLNYIRKPLYMHNAQDVAGGQYYLPDNVTLLSGSQDCELPFHTHSEIVDLAVLLTTGDLYADLTVKQLRTKVSD